MPLLKTSVGASPKGKTMAKTPVKTVEPIKVSLPTELSVAHHDINDYSILIHGEKKIGKSTLALEEEGVFLLTFDPLQKSMEIYQRHVPDWRHFLGYLDLLEKANVSGKFPYRRVVLDGADIWYRQCQDFVCKKLVIDHPSEEDWGKGWDALKTEFNRAVDRVLALPCGVWFISHSKWQEIETRQKGVKIEKLVPLLKAGGEEILVGKIDGWFAYDYEDNDRVLVVNGDERVAAGHRISKHFLTPKGRRIKEIPMGESSKEAYANLLKAFNNQQTFVNLAERDKAATPKGGAPLVKKPLLKK